MKQRIRVKISAIFFLSIFIFHFSSAAFDKSFSIVEKDDKKGLVNAKGELIIPAKYDDIGWSEGIPRVVNNVVGYKKNELWGLISIKNQKIVAPSYIAVFPIQNDRIIAAKIGRFNNELEYGVIDTKGKTLISFKYHSLAFDEKILIASTLDGSQERFGLINKKEKLILPFRYQNIISLGNHSYAVKDFKGKSAFYNARKDQLTKLNSDSIFYIDAEHAIISVGGRKGLVNSEGKVIIPPSYKQIKVSNHYFVNALPFPVWHVKNNKNETLRTYNYENIIPIGENILKVSLTNYEALIDLDNNLIKELKDTEIGTFSDQIAYVSSQGKKGIIKKDGSVLIPAIFDSIQILDQHFLVGKKKIQDYQWRILNHEGDSINAPAYHAIRKLNDNLFAVKLEKYWGLIDAEGNKIVTCKFNSIDLLPDQMLKVKLNKQSGVINQHGDWIIIPQKGYLTYINRNTYITSTEFCKTMMYLEGEEYYCTKDSLIKRKDDIIELKANGHKGLFNLKGERLLPTRHDFISELLQDSIYTFKKEGTYGIITKSGELLTEDRAFDELYELQEGFLGVKIRNRYGFVDPNGDLRIANRYDSIKSFKEGYAPIKLLGRWGFINKLERLKIQPLYDEVFPFDQGLAIVKKEGKYGLIDKEGNKVLNFEFDNLSRMDNGRYLSHQDDEYGLISKEGKEMVFPKYDSIIDLKNGYIIVERRGKFGVCNNDGLIAIPIIYDKVRYDTYNDHYLVAEKLNWEQVEISR